MPHIIFVCLGNICRSAMAEGMFAKMAENSGISGMSVDSAGTSDWHIGAAPDPRAIAASAARGIDIAGQRARQFTSGDFIKFDIIAAMDASNVANLRALAPAGQSGKVRLFLDFARDLPLREVPDPYYGGSEGFESTLDLLEVASRGLIDHIARSKP